MQVWKFTLKYDGKQTLEMPEGARIIECAMQHGVPTIWAMVHPTAKTETRRFLFVGTGHDFDARGVTHIGTFHDVPYVWHLFEVL